MQNLEQQVRICRKEVLEKIHDKLTAEFVDYRAVKELRILLETINQIPLT
jgi:uncharacterized protein (DUF488 family)